MIFIGIDPGMSGGIVSLKEKEIFYIGTFKDKTDKDLEMEFVKSQNWTIPKEPVFCLIENVHSFPGQGVSSTFKFGMNFGVLKGVLIACQIPHEFVSPQKWQKAMNCLTHGDKNISKAMAQRLFPLVKVTHATADALLLAEYCRRTVKQREGIVEKENARVEIEMEGI